MSGRLFELVLDGEVRYCVAYASDAERCAALHGAGAQSSRLVDPSASDPVSDSPARPRGRPSFETVLAEAVQTLQLDTKRPLAERARAVLRYLAETRDASEIPRRRTVENFLAAAPARRNSRKKSRKKSDRAKLTQSGG